MVFRRRSGPRDLFFSQEHGIVCDGLKAASVGGLLAVAVDPAETLGVGMSRGTPEEVVKSIVDGINTGNLDSLLPLYEPRAAISTQLGSLTHGLAGVREALAGFIAMKGKLDLKVTRVLEASDLALVTAVWSFNGIGPDGNW